MNFDKNVWEGLINFVKSYIKIDEKRIENIKNNKVAKLIAALPYIVKSEDPERYSFANFVVYLTSILKKDIAQHKKGETIENRVSFVLNFKNPDKDLEKRALNLLSLISLEDHKKDIEKDLEEGKYNPIAAHDIDYESTKKRYIENINKIKSESMDNILKPEDAIKSYWGV